MAHSYLLIGPSLQYLIILLIDSSLIKYSLLIYIIIFNYLFIYVIIYVFILLSISLFNYIF